MKRLLTLRDTQKRRQPSFTRLESWRYKRLKGVWRKPKGIDNHMRLKRKGWPKSVTVGYRSPKKVRGLHPSGFYEKLNPDLVIEIRGDAIKILFKRLDHNYCKNTCP